MIMKGKKTQNIEYNEDDVFMAGKVYHSKENNFEDIWIPFKPQRFEDLDSAYKKASDFLLLYSFWVEHGGGWVQVG